MVASDCTANPPPVGTTCATSADCCGKPCVNNTCGGACVPKGNTCTTSADCCPGIPCTIPPGALNGICGGTILPDGGVSEAGTTDGSTPEGGSPDSGGGNLPDGGTCSLYGQICTVTGDCCNAVPCTNGTCHFP
jgi:hypothetical protein